MPQPATLSTLRTAADITTLIGNTPVLELRRLLAPNSAALFAKLEFLNPGGSVKDRAALGMILDAEHRGLLHKDSIITEANAGNTPVLELRRLLAPNSAALFAKLEFLNPGGSVKDRAALGMILDAEHRGLLHKDSIITEATAGNTGVGLALVGVNRGYRVVLFVPEGFAEEKCALMRGFGAQVHRTPEAEGMAGAIRQAIALAKSDPNVWAALQFDNPANPQFHHDTTAAELWEQMDARIDAFVAGIGTGGTFTGIARFLKEQNPQILTVAVETQGSILQGGAPGPHKVEGIGVSFVPKTFDRASADAIVAVTDTDAFAMVKRLAAEEGLLAGSSSGAIVHAACEVAHRLGPGKRVATLIPDSAERYLSKKIFDGGV